MKLTKGYLNIVWTGSNFLAWFGEPEVKPKKWKPHSVILPKSMYDKEIMAEYSPTEITLDEMAYLLKTKKEMLTNGYANIFYVKDSAGVLRTVYVYWVDDGWVVGAFSVEDPFRWRDGHQVFSRNSVLKNSDTATERPSDTLTLTSSEKSMLKELLGRIIDRL